MSTPRAARMSAAPAVRVVRVHDSEERGRGQDSSSARVLAGAMAHIEAFEPLVTILPNTAPPLRGSAGAILVELEYVHMLSSKADKETGSGAHRSTSLG